MTTPDRDVRRWLISNGSRDAFDLEKKYVVLSSDFDALRAELEAANKRVEQYCKALGVLFTDDSGDLDYIKWYVTEKVLTIEARNAIDAAMKEQERE